MTKSVKVKLYRKMLTELDEAMERDGLKIKFIQYLLAEDVTIKKKVDKERLIVLKKKKKINADALGLSQAEVDGLKMQAEGLKKGMVANTKFKQIMKVELKAII